MILDDLEIAPSAPILTGQVGTTQIPGPFPVKMQLQSAALRADDFEDRGGSSGTMDWQQS